MIFSFLFSAKVVEIFRICKKSAGFLFLCHEFILNFGQFIKNLPPDDGGLGISS